MASLLLLTDQEAGRMPNHGVLSGDKTNNAVWVWAIGSPRARWLLGFGGLVAVGLARVVGMGAQRVAVPVTEYSFGVWSRRQGLTQALAAFGGVAILAGVLRSNSSFAVFGALVVLAAYAWRVRAFFNFWFSAELRADAGHVAISPSHANFDADAKKLFAKDLRR